MSDAPRRYVEESAFLAQLRSQIQGDEGEGWVMTEVVQALKVLPAAEVVEASAIRDAAKRAEGFYALFWSYVHLLVDNAAREG